MSLLEIILVGKTPLGSAVRAGVIGCLATTMGSVFFLGTMYPLIFGIAVVLILLPVVYLISKRDDPVEAAIIADRPTGASVPQTGSGTVENRNDAAPTEGPTETGR